MLSQDILLQIEECIQDLEIKFYNDRSESTSEILTRLTNILNDINGITLSVTSATRLYAIGIQLFSLPKKAHILHRRDIIFKVLHIGYSSIIIVSAKKELLTEQVTLQILELACIFGKACLDMGEVEKADQAFSAAKALNIENSSLNLEHILKYQDLQFTLHFYAAKMYLLKDNSQACSSMLDMAIQYINDSTPAKRVQHLCTICLRATVNSLHKNNNEEALIWCQVHFSKIEDKVLACGGVLASSLRIQNAKLQASILLNHETPEATASTYFANFLDSVSNMSFSDMLLHFMILKLKIKFFNTKAESLCEAYRDAMSQSRLTEDNVNIVVSMVDTVKSDVGQEELFQGLDQLAEKSTLHIGQSLRKENVEAIHIIKFHIVGLWFEDDPTTAISLLRLACEDIQLIKTDLENVTLYSICMNLWKYGDRFIRVKAFRTAAFCFEHAKTLYNQDICGDTNLMIMRRRLALCYYENEQWDLAEETLERNLLQHPPNKEAVDILMMIKVLLAKHELSEVSSYLVHLPNSKGYNDSISNILSSIQQYLKNLQT